MGSRIPPYGTFLACEGGLGDRDGLRLNAMGFLDLSTTGRPAEASIARSKPAVRRKATASPSSILADSLDTAELVIIAATIIPLQIRMVDTARSMEKRPGRLSLASPWPSAR